MTTKQIEQALIESLNNEKDLLKKLEETKQTVQRLERERLHYVGEVLRLNQTLLEMEAKRVSGELSDGYHTHQELYEHRNWLFVLYCNDHPFSSWKSKRHSDGSELEGWFIVGTLGSGNKQITYHLPIELWDALHVPAIMTGVTWDGHTSKDVIERLKAMTK